MFFLKTPLFKVTCFWLGGGSNSSTHKFVGECNIGLVRERVPASHMKTIPAMGCCCCCDQEKVLVDWGWMDGLIEVISHVEIKDTHCRKTACLCMIIISGGSRGIPSEAGVIPLIKSTYRISSWLCHFIERKHSSWLLEQSPNLLLYAFRSQYSDFYAALHRFHPGHLTENGLGSGAASAWLDRRPTGCESFRLLQMRWLSCQKSFRCNSVSYIIDLSLRRASFK